MSQSSHKLPTINIGIPAYNEERSLPHLLQSLVQQKQHNFILKNIFVASDGSSDRTSSLVEKMGQKYPIITLIGGTKRKGKSFRLQQMLRHNTSDFLFFLDADIRPLHARYLQNIVSSTKLSFDLLGLNAHGLPQPTFLSRCLAFSAKINETLKENWDHGDNLLSFHGCFLGLSRRAVNAINMPAHVVNNDAYFYFSAKKLGLKTRYLEKSKVFFTSPSTWADYLKQSKRYQMAPEELAPEFPELDIRQEYRVPKKALLSSLLSNFFANPLYVFSFVMIFALARIATFHSPTPTTLWDTAHSTKGGL